MKKTDIVGRVNPKDIRTFDAKEMKYMKQVIDKGELGLVPDGMVVRFEKAFAKYTGAKVAMARNNAMSGLCEAVSVSGAKPGTEVICDPIVHFGGLATAYFNAVPRFADVDYNTFNMDPDSLEANITSRTKAVIVTHLWGLCADMDRIKAICKKRGLFLIEDCAHTVGAYWNNKHAGTFGDLGVFSFQEYKQLSTGDGGMTITNDTGLAKKMNSVWAFKGESPIFLSLNWRMNEVTAAIGLAQLERVNSYLKNVYNVTNKILNDAIRDCVWLRNRTVPDKAEQAGYFFACAWEGDKYGLSYAKFKKITDKLGLGLRFGFNHVPPYEFAVFKKANLYKHPDCPVRCPYYTKVSNYRYKKGLCPTTEELMPRLITVNLIFLTVAQAKEKAEKLQEAIRLMEK